MPRDRSRTIITIAAPVAASVFVMAFELLRGAKDSMWPDEIFSVRTAHRSFGELIRILWSQEPNMGPYYLALWFWLRIGEGDTWIRALSALSTVAAIWGIWVVVRRWSGVGAAAVAVAVFAVSPFVLSWAMQARGYSMAMAFTAWALVFADSVVRGSGRWSGAISAGAFGAMAGLAVATQFSTGFVMLGIAAAMVALSPSRRMVRDLAVAGVVAVVCLAPFSRVITERPDHASWVPPLDGNRFVKSMFEVSSGPFWASIILIGLVCLMVASVRDARSRPYLLALAGVASGILGLVAFSILLRPMFVSRYLAACVPLAVIAAVGGWSSLRSRRWSNRAASIAAIAIVGVFAVNLVVSVDQTRPFLRDFKGAAALLESAVEPQDVIVADPGYFIHGIQRYLPANIPTHTVALTAETPDAVRIRDKSGGGVQADRIWVVRPNRAPASKVSFDKWKDSSEWITNEFPTVEFRERLSGLIVERRVRPTSG